MKKNRKKRGFTLTEVLVATALLALFVSMAIVGTSALFGTGEQMMAVSKAAVLGSDVMKAVTNEIRFGEEFSLKGEGEKNTITYKSTSFGEGCEMKLDDEGRLIIVQSKKTFYPIGSAAYGEVQIKSVSFAIEKSKEDKNRQIISCTLAIGNGDAVLWKKTMSAIPLAQKTTTE